MSRVLKNELAGLVRVMQMKFEEVVTWKQLTGNRLSNRWPEMCSEACCAECTMLPCRV